MGLGDERGANLEKYEHIATALGNETYPDMRVVPDGNHGEWRRQREAVVRSTPAILARLVVDGLIEFETLQERYTGGQ